MTNEWHTRMLELAHRSTEAEDLEFVRLVEMATWSCDFETCQTLVRTFVTDNDYGVQESVVSVLSSAKTEDYQRALLEELPRMVADAPEWAEVLVEREVKNNQAALRKSLANVSFEARQFFEIFTKSN